MIARLLRFVLLALLAVWTAALVRSLLRRGRRSAAPGAAGRRSGASLPLHRDPWCGAHVSGEISRTLQEAGDVLHFCSEECRERYRASRRRSA